MSNARISTITVKPLTTSKKVHAELAEALPVYDTTRRWLELQRDVIREGMQPVRLLKKLLEISAMFTEGNISERELRYKIYALLS
jgi:hypothetical protein